jgi:hypothetical protein
MNTIQNIIKHHPQTDKCNKSGIYQMKYLDCPLKYIGQTNRSSYTRYKEHIQAIRNNNSNSGCSSHIVNMGHTYRTITDIMDIIRTQKTGKHINTLQKYYICNFSKNSLYMNDTNIDTHNPIFRKLQEMNTS